MAPEESFRLLPVVLPPLRKWVADVVGAAHGISQPACSVADSALRACFPDDFLRRTRVVLTDDVPRPPLHEFGLPGPDPLGEAPLDGIALGTTYFVRRSADRPDLHFHELVHLVQWRRLGTDNFLLAYGAGLFSQGYRASSLEVMAYDLQAEFVRNVCRLHLMADIERQTDVIWDDARQRLTALNVNTIHSIHSDWIMGGRL